MILFFFLYTSFLNQPADHAWDLLAQQNQYASARTAYEELLKTDPSDPFSNIGWFLTFTGQGSTVELHHAALAVLERVPMGSPATEFVLIWMQSFREYLPDFEESISKFLIAKLPIDQQSNTFSILKSNYLTRLAKQRGDEELYERARSESHTLKQWLFAKRVGQYPIPDFYKNWSNLDWEHGASINSINGTIVPPPRISGPGVLFAASNFETPSAQNLVLRLFSYQNIDVYIDGNRIIRHLRRETMGPAIQTISFPVKRGVHEIQIKTTQTGKRNGHFQIQLTAGKPLVFLSPTPPKHTLSNKVLDTSIFKSDFQKLLERKDGNHTELRSFLSALMLMREKDLEPAISAFETLVENHPDSQLLGGQLIKFYLDGVPFISQERQIGRAYALLEKLSSAGPDMLPENELLLASVLIKAKQTKDALSLLQQVVEENPSYCEALNLLLALADKENLLDIKAEVLDHLERFGADHRWAQEQLLVEARREGNIEEVKSLLSHLRTLFPWGKYESEYHEVMGDYQAAIQSLVEHMRYFPNSTYYPFAISKLYRKLDDTENQILWLEKTRALDATHKSALIDIVNLDLYQGRAEEAAGKLDEYISLVPHDGTIRQMRSHLRGETYFEPFRVDTSSVIESAETKPKSRGADSELLLDQLMVRLFPDGSQMRYTHLVTRVLTKKGVDRESEIQLPPHCEILELRTIKQDGKVFYPENIKNKNSLSLSGISVGDFIDEEHIEYIAPAYYDRDGLDGGMSFIFRGIDRIFHHSECVIIYSKDLAVEPVFYEQNFPGQVEKTEKNGLIYMRWVTKDVSPLVPEPAMPNPAQIMPRISFSYNTSWEEIRDFFLNANRSSMKVSNSLTELALKWKAEFPDPVKRAEHMYRFVTDEIEPSRNFYRNINLTWEHKEGNATLLLAALYPVAGIPCHVAFSRTAAYEKSILDTPFPDLFFRTFLILDLPGKTFWVDANRGGLPFGYISPEFFGAKAIILDSSKNPCSTVPSQDSEYEPVEARYRLVIQPDGGLSGWGEESFNGLLAARLTTYYEELSEEERLKNVEAGVNERFPQSNVSEVLLEENPEPGHFSLNYSFEAANWVHPETDGIHVSYPLPRSPLRDYYANLASRSFPVAIESAIKNVAKMSLRVPESHHWSDPQLERQITSDFGSYELKITATSENEIQLQRVYQLPAQEISPEQYPEFQKFCQDILAAEQITLHALLKEKP